MSASQLRKLHKVKRRLEKWRADNSVDLRNAIVQIDNEIDGKTIEKALGNQQFLDAFAHEKIRRREDVHKSALLALDVARNLHSVSLARRQGDRPAPAGVCRPARDTDILGIHHPGVGIGKSTVICSMGK